MTKDGGAPGLARVALVALVFAVACSGTRGTGRPDSHSSLTVGIGPLPSTSPQQGVQQLVQILSTEPLVRFTDEGRPAPGLAREWSLSPDGRSLTVVVRDGVTFHDGSPLSVDQIATSLNAALPRAMGPAFADVKSLSAASNQQLDFVFSRPSPFMLEALETVIQKPGAPGVGTGPYLASRSKDTNEIVANQHYYLGRPLIDRLIINTYPTTRAAWADMLRGRVGMLLEVDPDAVDSLEASSSIKLFTFTRRYQMMIVFNPASKALNAPAVRRSLNNAVDRDAMIKEALGGFGEPSVSPIWLHHWAFPKSRPHFSFDPAAAAAALPPAGKGAGRLAFSCLIPQGQAYERIALVVKRQLAAVGVDMDPQQVTMNDFVNRLAKGEYEAALVEGINGPTMFRVYEWWHTGGSLNFGRWGSPGLDEAFDRLRHAANDDEYAKAVEGIHLEAMNNPPAIFLAWGQRARAVSTRFVIPSEPGRDILPTIRLWKPAS
jgi:peptide/nickel transport system substrate-binding protein